MFFWNSFDDTSDVGNLISGSSAFSKYSLNIWKFTIHILLKSGLENFEHYLLVCQMSAIVQWYEHYLALPFFGNGMKTDLFQSCGHCWVFQICWHIEWSTFTASSFRIWKMMLWKCCTQNDSKLENSAVAIGLEKVNFHSSPKEGQCQRMFKLLHNCIHLIC